MYNWLQACAPGSWKVLLSGIFPWSKIFYSDIENAGLSTYISGTCTPSSFTKALKSYKSSQERDPFQAITEDFVLPGTYIFLLNRVFFFIYRGVKIFFLSFRILALHYQFSLF